MESVFSATMPSAPLKVTVTVRLSELYVAVYPLVSMVLPFFTVTDFVTSPVPTKSTGSTQLDSVSVMEKTLIFAEEVMLE